MKKPPSVSDSEKKTASSLVENRSADFAPGRFGDDYQEQLRTLVAAKLEQGDAVDTADEKKPAKKTPAKKSA